MNEMKSEFVKLATGMGAKKHWVDKAAAYSPCDSNVVQYLSGCGYAKQMVFDRARSMGLIVFDIEKQVWVGVGTAEGKAIAEAKLLRQSDGRKTPWSDGVISKRMLGQMTGRPSKIKALLEDLGLLSDSAFLSRFPSKSEVGLGLNEAAKLVGFYLLEKGNPTSLSTCKRIIPFMVERGWIFRSSDHVYFVPSSLSTLNVG